MARVIDPEKVAALIADIAETEIAPRYRKLQKHEIREKSGPHDLVTEVDEAAERALRAALMAIRPDAAFVGEEAAAANSKIAEELRRGAAAWIVDPLDGTRNFVTGVDEFGTIVAFVENGEAQMGWIYAIPAQKMAVGVRSEGASWAGKKIAPKKAPGGRMVALRSLGFLPPPRADYMRGLLKENFDSRPGYCSAYAYIALASGEVDFKISSRIHPWDHVAGAVLVKEAGGRIAWLDDGTAYAPQPSADRLLLATAPGRSWDEVAEILRR